MLDPPDADRLYQELVDVLRQWAVGNVPPPIAQMRLILLVPDGARPADLLERAIAAAAEPGEAVELRRLAALAAADEATWQKVRLTAAAIPHDASPAGGVAEEVRRLAERFDAAARVSPEASVALYSLGDPARLEAATSEIADWLENWGLLGPDRAVLDIGCGIGRLERALAARVGRMVGADISAEMVAVARARSAGLANVEFHLTDGLDLAPFPEESFDLVLAADVFPYLVAAGGNLAERHVNESARVLRPGGTLAVLNYSYRSSLDEDRDEVERFGRSAGLHPREGGIKPFRLWDGAAFLLSKP